MNLQINIKELIKRYDLSAEALAKVLFPDVKYPKLAFARLQKGETTLDITQLSALATYIGVPAAELLSEDFWKGGIEDNCLVFLRGEYKAKLNYNGAFLSLYRNNELLSQEICGAPNMSIPKFIKYLDTTIKNLENGSI